MMNFSTLLNKILEMTCKNKHSQFFYALHSLSLLERKINKINLGKIISGKHKIALYNENTEGINFNKHVILLKLSGKIL